LAFLSFSCLFKVSMFSVTFICQHFAPYQSFLTVPPCFFNSSNLWTFLTSPKCSHISSLSSFHSEYSTNN
jgi:hypothetical protein